MKIKEEWVRILAEALEGENPLGTIFVVEDALSIVAPLIAAEAIEACAKVADYRAQVGKPVDSAYWHVATSEAIAHSIRREVPRLLGLDDEIKA